MAQQIYGEAPFEELIEAHLLANGYVKGAPANFDRETALDVDSLFAFIATSQPKKWEKLGGIHGTEIRQKVVRRLVREIQQRGVLDVFRHGIDDYGVHLDLAYFLPASGLNQGIIDLYRQNILTVTRQLRYRTGSEKSVDLVLSVNGVPLVTAELKNPLTGQRVQHAVHQYRADRDPKDLLFQFNRRALVHFAVDPDEVRMATRLDGSETRFWPFNRGRNHGAGNDDIEGKHRTAYLWEEVWQRDSLLDILAHFVQLEVSKKNENGRDRVKETLIFPRYHQLRTVRKILKDARQEGAGQTYLIQHSAGSGKSNTIAWTAHRLSSLHDANDEPVFDSVIVITDRIVLDQQLQETVYQFDHKRGVVECVEDDSAQLAAALQRGVRIIVTTIHKFAFVVDLAGRLPDRKYALILDEAHSSQSGDLADNVRKVLTSAPLTDEDLTAAEAAEDRQEDSRLDAEDLAAKHMGPKGRPSNLSFFAFTATPKNKTLELFGRPGSDGLPVPFDLYSMRQAIEEGFILNVLLQYATYKMYFDLTKRIQEDPEFDKKKASRAIARFVHLHPHNLAQKTEIIIEHFRQFVRHKIGGRAKAMVVTGSRLQAIRYKQEFDRYIQDKGYDINTLIAFSGMVVDESGFEYTEAGMNRFPERELPERFDSDDYQVLLVANKYQTGYDQPLLHTMYVDKKLTGIRAVQTLSRLNRPCPGKEDTFVLDFANDTETIRKAFLPYYKETRLTQVTDPNLVYDMRNKLDQKGVYWDTEVEAFCRAFYDEGQPETARVHQALYQHIQPAVDRFRRLGREEQDEFRHLLTEFTRFYAYISLLSPVSDARLEMLYTYGRFLLRYIEEYNVPINLNIDGDVALKHYRLQKKFEGAVDLMPGEAELPPAWVTGGPAQSKHEKAALSEIIDILNDRFKPDPPFNSTDQLLFEQIVDNMTRDGHLASQAVVNPVENYRFGFDAKWDEKLIELMDRNQELFARIVDDPDFGAFLKDWVMAKVYRNQRAAAGVAA